MSADAAATWDGLAAGWRRRAAQLDAAYRPVRSWLVDHLDLRPGDHLLELAAGTGSAGFAALDALAARGPAAPDVVGVRLTSTDLAPEMVAIARERGTGRGLPPSAFRVMSADRITLDDGSADRVLCESGFMIVPDPQAALRETRRVLRPGGRLAFSVWGPPEHNPWDTVGHDLLAELGHLPAPDRDTPGARTADRGHTLGLLERAGFAAVRDEAVPVTFAYRDVDEWVRWSIETDTTGPALAALSGAAWGRFRARLVDALEPYRAGPGYELPGLALCVLAT